MNIYRNKRTLIPKTIDPKPPPQNTQDTSLKHSECALGLVTSRLIGTGHFRPPVLGPSKGQSGVLCNGSAQGYL